jgi:hypothetical protein
MELACYSTTHEAACENFPGLDQLREWIDEGLSLAEMADKCDVSHSLIHRWLRANGLQTKKAAEWGVVYRVDRAYGNRRKLDLVPELKAAECRSCLGCEHIEECHQREAAGLWVLCETPERELVELCIREGLVPADILEANPAAG